MYGKNCIFKDWGAHVFLTMLCNMQVCMYALSSGERLCSDNVIFKVTHLADLKVAALRNNELHFLDMRLKLTDKHVCWMCLQELKNLF